MTEWARGPQFASPAAASEWAPVIQAAAAAWDALEVQTVASGFRQSALVYLNPDELIRATADAAANGFDVVPLAQGDGRVRAAICPPGSRSEWVAAWREADHDQIGALLGFPSCCLDYFRQNWAKGRIDTVLTMQEKDGPPEANVYHRHIGIRLVPHLPCSADCIETIVAGRAAAVIGRKAGLDVDAIYRVLELPVRYSTRAGIAITETPHWRVFSGTDQGAGAAARVGIPTGCGKSQVLARDPEIHYDGPPVCEDNGFKSSAGMEAAHAIVAKIVNRAVVTSALDLGAGDGTLLAQIAASRPGQWVGVECDAGRVVRGAARHPGVALVCDRIESFKWGGEPFDVVLLMPGRLLEMSQSDAERVREWLPRVARRLVVYTYGDRGELRQLCESAKLEVGNVTGAPYAQVAEGRI